MSAEQSNAPGGAKLDLSESQQAAISRLQTDENVIPPPIWLARQAHISNDAVERAHAASDPKAFWDEKAKGVDWIEPYSEVFRFDLPKHEWFLGGKLNAAANCIDRHVYGDRRNKAALIWVGEDGEEHTYTYSRLYREVNRFANALKRLGVGKGDRVIIYMPLVPEGDHHDARLRPDRRDPLGRLRRDGDPGAPVPDRRLPGEGDRLLGLHLPARQEDPPEADDRRGRPRPRLRRARRRPPARLERRRRAVRVRERARARLLRHPERERDPLPAGADGLGGPALHPLHVRDDGDAEGGRPHDGRLHGRRHLALEGLLPDRRAGHLLVAPRTSAGSSATRSSSTGRSPSARRSSAARACPTGRRPR